MWTTLGIAALTDGSDDVKMILSVLHLDSEQEIYSHGMTVRFVDPLRVVNVRFRVRQLVFHSAGTHLFSLSAGHREIATRRVRVYDVGGSP
jgi:hypothetical protein